MRLSPLTNLSLLCLHIRWPAFLWIWKMQGINKVFKSASALSLLFLYKFLKGCTWMTLFMEGLCDLVYFNCSSAFTKHLSSAVYTMITWSSAKKSVFTVWFFWNSQSANYFLNESLLHYSFIRCNDKEPNNFGLGKKNNIGISK